MMREKINRRLIEIMREHLELADRAKNVDGEEGEKIYARIDALREERDSLIMFLRKRGNMVKRVCPSCGASWYSADTSEKAWRCERCGAEIPKKYETGINEEKIMFPSLNKYRRKPQNCRRDFPNCKFFNSSRDYKNITKFPLY